MAAKKGSKSSKSSKKSSAQAPVVLKAISEKQTKSQILTAIAEMVDVPKKVVQQVLAATGELALRHMKKRGSGEFAIPEMHVRLIRKVRPARPKRKGRNPATGEEIMIAARPARAVVKARPLKILKESVNS